MYWPALMGAAFRRDPEGGGPNGALNYGYTVLRAAAARAIVGVGLHPSLGIFHAGKRDPFQLADDLMEPFRPLVDEEVHRHGDTWAGPLDPTRKAALVALTTAGLPTDQGVVPVVRVLIGIAQSLVEVFQGRRSRLWLPDAWEIVRQERLDLDD
ncbi:CRISPR-associated endonuclease Cas1 [Pararhodospirillum oryzae]|uniref:CRISPR-associated endonuclease Cas1 n=1 Tax=Pararhodospirillum oryzae TaxID=478448 RepID=A0A512H689_9PROT|nr:CRISPR-associated endonuclease Cas1 [Pararhodospirillum oryzae]GEO80952.1 hypothetical protein ROR02_10830 [Pararhodospirillum oryzae]